jgi:hypothetical protein
VYLKLYTGKAYGDQSRTDLKCLRECKTLGVEMGLATDRLREGRDREDFNPRMG